MARISPEEVLKRHKKADARKEEWRTIYEECYEFALPQRNLYDGYYEGGTPGQNKMARVFDSTAINSTQRFANRIQSALFPPYRAWCELTPGNEIPKERRAEIREALEMYSERMFDVIRQTNFDLAISEFLLDLCVGTAVMLVQPGDDDAPVRFIPVPQYLVSLEEGPYGTVDNVYRRLRIRGEAISRQWPDAVIPQRLQEMIDQKPEQEIDMVEATVYNTDEDIYCYHLIWPKDKSELVYRTMNISPWIVARFMKVPGEVYGRGPLVTALPDIKTLNKVKELVLKNASLAVAGVYTAADDGVLNPQTIQITPGAIIPVARNGGPQGESLRPLRSASDFNTSQLVINDLVTSIKRMLYDDSLPPDTMSARSATEIVQRMKELSQNLGSAYGRLITEAMTPLVRRILYVMDEMNIIDLPLEVNGLQVKIVPNAPLAQAQNMDELEKVLQFGQVAQQFGMLGQVAVNQEEMLEYIAVKMGVPQSLLNTPEQREIIMQQMQQQQQAAMQSPEAPAV
jgi:Bacteriophage head to tail connecting protein.